NLPLDLATVYLLDAQDSTIAYTIFPDKQGGFTFTGVARGSYRVTAVLVGYDDGISEPINITSAEGSKDVGNLVLSSGNTVLDEVTVAAPQRPMVERRADMLVVNVENSTLAAGNTAMDILERSPGVTVDKDDNISLMGKQGLTVMIDGRQTYLSAEQLANF